MEYICLRNCYVSDCLWEKDRTYNLPDNMDKAEKNFRLIGDVPLSYTSESNITKNRLRCSVCGKECKNRLGLLSHQRSHKIDN